MAKDYTKSPVFALSEFPPDALLVSQGPAVMRLIMDRMNNVIQDLYTQAIKVGHIVPWFWEDIPDGALECNGQQYDTVKYSQLFNLLKTDRVPDLRGKFIRGWANGDDEYDPDFNRALASIQGHAIAKHSHGTPISRTFAPTAWIERRDGSGGPAFLNSSGQTDETGGTETRPVNIAAKYIIFAIGTDRLVDGSTQLGSIQVTPDVILGVTGQTGTLTVTPVPAGVTFGPVTFTSSDPTIVTVTSSGLYTLVANGTAVISIQDTNSGMTRTISVTVYTKIEDIDVTFPATMRPNSSAYPIITTIPAGISHSLSYEVLDLNGDVSTLAWVSPDGRVTSYADEGPAVLVVTATDRGGNTVRKEIPFNIAIQNILQTISLSIADEIPVGTQAMPQLVVNPTGIQVLTEYEVIYDPVFGTTVAVADKASGQVTGLYANASATLKVTVRDLQGNSRIAYAPFVVTNSNWFVEKVYCRMDIVGTTTVFSNGQQFKVTVTDKLGVMDFQNISTEHLTGYSTNATLVSTVKSVHSIEYTLEFKPNTPAGTLLQLDWLPTENNTNPSDTGWPTTGDPVEYCQCRNWKAVSNGVNSIGVPKLKLTYVNGYDVYNGVFKEAIIIDENNFLDFTANHGSNSITAIGVQNGGQEVISANMVRVPRLYFTQGTPVGTTGGIRWASVLNPSYYIEDFGMTSLGDAPNFVIEFNTVDNATFRSQVTTTTGDAKDPVKDRVYQVRIRDLNGVTDFTTLQTPNDWNTFQFNNTYRSGNMTVTASSIIFEIRMNKGVVVGGSGGIRWTPNILTDISSSGIISDGETLVDVDVLILNDNFAVTAYNTQRIPILVGSPTGKYPMTSANLITGNANVSIIASNKAPITVNGKPYLPAFLQLNSAAIGPQSVVVRYDSSDTYSDEVIITGAGNLPSGTNRNTNGLVLNIISQFVSVEAKCSFTVANISGVQVINIDLFGDAGITVKPGTSSIVGVSGTFTAVATGVPRSATVYAIPADGVYSLTSANALLALIGG